MFDFGEALRRLKEGELVRREGWNGKGMFLVLVPEKESWGPNASGECKVRASISLWTARQEWQPGWVASQEDMLSEDWCVASAGGFG